ncbi:hypothetical protein [Agromyces humi]|uniref:hypothetical protein n=1 Tax=Agromyces humi TaxID=1766800 RepID=UPI00135C5BFD|nr:hypothetical protein [Agromyces humi]
MIDATAGPKGRQPPFAVWNVKRNGRTTDAAPVLGILESKDGTLNAAATKVSIAAPKQFNLLSEAYFRAQHVLDHDDAAYICATIADGVEAAAQRLDGKGALDANALEALNARVEFAVVTLRRREGEMARRLYARGLLRGAGWSLAILLVLGIVMYLVMWLWLFWRAGGRSGSVDIPPEHVDALRDTLVAIAGGAAGACVSVLLRLHRVNNITVEAVNQGTAFYRIALGWFFGAIVVFFIKGGILFGVFPEGTADLSTDATDELLRVSSFFFWGAVGFIAGFNERWATNLITRDPSQVIRLDLNEKPEANPPDVGPPTIV